MGDNVSISRKLFFLSSLSLSLSFGVACDCGGDVRCG